MTEDQGELARWSAAFRADPEPGAGPCLPPETIFNAAHGRLAPEHTRSVVDHTARCGACAEEWRFALAVGTGEGGQVIRLEDARDRRASWTARLTPYWAAAAAVFALIAVGVSLQTRDTIAPPSTDGGVTRGTGVRPEAPVGPTSLPREAFVVTWAAVPGATGYHVVVKTEDLVTTVAEVSVNTPELRLGAAELEKVPAGARLVIEVVPTGAGDLGAGPVLPLVQLKN